MCQKYTAEELNKMNHKDKDAVIYQMQDRLEQNYENLIEQIQLANQQRFGRQSEQLDTIAGQLSFLMKWKLSMMTQCQNLLLKILSRKHRN